MATLWTTVYFLSRKRFEKRRRRLFQSSRVGRSQVRLKANTIHLLPELHGISELLILYGIHEPISTRVFLEMLASDDQLIDIGSNIGYYPLLALDALGDEGRVLCFEPLPKLYDVLDRNVGGDARAKMFALAVGNSTGTISFFRSEFPNWGTIVGHERSDLNRSIEVEAIALDDFITERGDFAPTFIRMDIEGGESLAFEGAWKTIESYKPKLFVEFHPQFIGSGPIVTILKKLHRLGYRRAVFIARKWDEAWTPWWTRLGRTKTESLEETLERIAEDDSQAPFSLFISR